MATVASNNEAVSGNTPSKAWEDFAALFNAIGAFVVAGGALMSVLGDSYGIGGLVAIIIYYVVMAAIFGVMVRGACVRRKMKARLEAKTIKEQTKEKQDSKAAPNTGAQVG